MNKLRLRPRLAALLTASIVCLCLLALSSAPAWAKVGSITEFLIPTSGSRPQGITLGPDGNLWFTEAVGNKIGRITPKGKVTEFTVPTASSSPQGITAGPDGNLWFTESGLTSGGNKIGRITTSGESPSSPCQRPVGSLLAVCLSASPPGLTAISGSPS